MKTFDEFFNIEDQCTNDNVDAIKDAIKAAEKKVTDQMKERSHMTAAEARKKIHESLFGKDTSAGEELDFWDKSFMPARDFTDYLRGVDEGADEPDVAMKCEVKLEKDPDPAKEEIFATCLNFLHNHTEDELYEIVRLAFKAAEVFGY